MLPTARHLLVLALCASLSSAFAGKPKWEDDDHHRRGKPHHENRKGDDRERAQRVAPGVSVQIQIGGYFGEDQRRAARAYYEPRWKAGKCPPGLAKKGNGCRPPGQARHWHRGEPLPRDVVYYPVPSSVQVQLGTPPAGHKFVRVATDILLIAVGTGMVVDAIEDLGGL
jgi:Ni/Co efflux regulator RcnB